MTAWGVGLAPTRKGIGVDDELELLEAGVQPANNPTASNKVERSWRVFIMKSSFMLFVMN
jgi:hypothetical protein